MPCRVFTEEEDKKILEYYNSDFYKNQNKSNFENPYTIKDLCKDLKADKKLIVKRASELGFTNFKKPAEKDYADRELEILSKNVNIKTPTEIKRLLENEGFKRTIISINVKLTRMNFSLKLNGTGDLNITLLAEAMGVDTHYFTDNKERLKKLNPKFDNNQYIISRRSLREYIINNPYDFNIGKVEPKFFIDLLSDCSAILNVKHKSK